MRQKNTKKIVIGIVAVVLLVVVLLFLAYQIPGVHFLGKLLHVNVEEEFYQYDVNGELIGTIPVKFKGLLNGAVKSGTRRKQQDFRGTVEVEGYELQYMEDWMPDEQIVNAVVLYDEEGGYVHLLINGMKSVVEHNIPKFLHSDYQYNITCNKENPGTIIIRVGQLEKTASKSGGWHIEYPHMFYAVLAENEEAGAQLIAPELEYLEQGSSQDESAELIHPEETSSAPSSSQETSAAPEAPEHLQAVGDVDGDGTEEILTLGGFDDLGIKASLWVDDEKVIDLQGQGELGEYSCRLAAVDLNKDGQDEVLVLVCVASSINDASFRYVEWKDGAWQEWPKVQLPKLEMTLDNDWQCMVTDGTEEWTVEVKNPTLRAEWFDEAGLPVAGPMQAGASTSNANHIIEDGKIYFNAEVAVRNLGENGGRWDEIWGEPVITVSYENGQLVTDDALIQAVLNVLTDTGE